MNSHPRTTVLCYGDSNTWGTATVARPDGRYAPDERWPGVMRLASGLHWDIIEEGLPGRTTVNDDPVEGVEKNGSTYLLPCLASHKPIDIVVIMLGTNDLKARFNKSAWDIAAGVGRLVGIVKTTPAVGRGGRPPEILVVCPPPMQDSLPGYAEMFAGAQAKSKEMALHMRRMAKANGARFFDAGTVIQSSTVDGFHLDPEAHATLGRAIAGALSEISGSLA